MKKGRLASIALSCIVAAGLFVVPTGAKSAQAGAAVEPVYFEGVTMSEIILLSDATHVEVEKEKLTFHAEKRPIYGQMEEYKGSVRAEYALYNPSGEDETLRLALPLGEVSNYYYEYGNRKIENEYAVTVDGERVETRLRHSYLTDYDTPTAENLTQVSEIFREDMPVNEYAYTVTLPDSCFGESDYSFALEVQLHYNPSKSFIFSSDLSGYYYENGNMMLEFCLGGHATPYNLHVDIAGEDAEFISARVKKTDGTTVKGAGISRIPSYVSDSNLAGYVCRYLHEAVEYEDWARCYCNYLESCRPYADKLAYGELYRYAEYEITVPAGGRVTHVVEMPLIPTVRGDKSFYAYNFDGARAWANYGTLDVEIYSEKRPTDCSLTLTEGEGIFTHNRNNLPMGDLRFSLGEYEGDSWVNGNNNDLSVALIILAVLAVVAAGTALIIVMVRRKRLKMLAMRAEAEAQAKKENIEKSDEEEKK